MTETLTIKKPQRAVNRDSSQATQLPTTTQMTKNRINRESVPEHLAQELENNSRSTSLPDLMIESRNLSNSDFELMLECVLAAFPETRDWRNAWGLSQATGYPEHLVVNVIDHYSDYFEIAPFEIAESKFYRPRATK